MTASNAISISVSDAWKRGSRSKLTFRVVDILLDDRRFQALQER